MELHQVASQGPRLVSKDVTDHAQVFQDAQVSDRRSEGPRRVIQLPVVGDEVHHNGLDDFDGHEKGCWQEQGQQLKVANESEKAFDHGVIAELDVEVDGLGAFSSRARCLAVPKATDDCEDD